MKNIAIDARPLSSELTGIGRYLFNVLVEILNNDTTNKYYLYTSNPLRFEFDNIPNVKIRMLPTKTKLRELIITQTIFPLWAMMDDIDTFWSPRHHLPLILGLTNKVKKVVTVHDIVWIKHPETMNKNGLLIEKLFFKRSLKISDKIITLSNFTKNELKEHLLIPEKKINTTGVGCFHEEQKDEFDDLPLHHPYFLFVGTLEPRKNLRNILGAYKNFCLTNNEIDLVLVGKNGWGTQLISEVVKELGIENRVKQLGFVEDSYLTYLYKNCELLLMPSIYEGFGFPALEALSYHKKVIVTKNSAIAELNGDNVIISETTIDSILTAIEYSQSLEPKEFSNINTSWEIPAQKTTKILTS